MIEVVLCVQFAPFFVGSGANDPLYFSFYFFNDCSGLFLGKISDVIKTRRLAGSKPGLCAHTGAKHILDPNYIIPYYIFGHVFAHVTVSFLFKKKLNYYNYYNSQ